MTQFDPQAVQVLSDAISQLDDAQLEDAITGMGGGVDGALEQAFAGMAAAFVPERAAGRTATIQWHLTTPDGPRNYQVRISPTGCEVEPGLAAAADLTLGLKLTDFFRLILGQLDGMQAFMTSRLQLTGDITMAMGLQTWFDQPGGTT